MGMARIMVLSATFFTVAACPTTGAAVMIFFLGVMVYGVLWGHEFFRKEDRQ